VRAVSFKLKPGRSILLVTLLSVVGNLSLSANIVNHAVPRQFYILRMP
jgi:hypothetical protein